MALNYRVFIRDDTNTIVEELSDWITLQAVKKYNNMGTWLLELDINSVAVELLTTKQNGIVIIREIDGVATTVFSGSILTEQTYTQKTFRVAGVSDEVILLRAVRPDYQKVTGPFDNDYYLISGQASTMLYQIVNDQIGVNAPYPWKNNYLTIGVDPRVGGTIVLRSYLDVLLTLLRITAASSIAGGLGFRVQQPDYLAPGLEYTVFVPADRSADVEFSINNDTIQEYSDKWSAAQGNYFYVLGGDGFGHERTVVEGGDAIAIAEVGKFLTQVIDKRGVVDPGELQQALAEAIAGAVNNRVINIVPNPLSINANLVYGVDYELGDLVSVTTKAGTTVQQITEITIDLNPQTGALISPTISSPTGTNDTTTSQAIASIQDRISNIERNWNVPNDSITEDMLHPFQKNSPGDLKMTTRSAVQPGWKFCDGTALDRTIYSRLFQQIGETFGAGNGTTTFNLPNFIDRFPMGQGGMASLGYGGSFSVPISITVPVSVVVPAHSHNHSHGLSNHLHAGIAHTHPSTHSHGMHGHTHSVPAFSHHHTVNIDHTHGSFQTLGENFDTIIVGIASPSSGTTDHHHSFTIPALGTTNKTTDDVSGSPSTSGPASPSTTDQDTNAGDAAASYGINSSVPVPNSSEQDSTSGGGATISASGTGSTTVTVIPQFTAVNFEIYTGVT